MPNKKVEIEFIATATIEVNLEDLDSEEYDLSHPDELKQAIDTWVGEKIEVKSYYSDYSGDYSQITIRDRKCQMEVLDTTDVRVLEVDS